MIKIRKILNFFTIAYKSLKLKPKDYGSWSPPHFLHYHPIWKNILLQTTLYQSISHNFHNFHIFTTSQSSPTIPRKLKTTINFLIPSILPKHLEYLKYLNESSSAQHVSHQMVFPQTFNCLWALFRRFSSIVCLAKYINTFKYY